jgi:threonine dehydrogenase-like Zn-dependent dehydrogenase
MKALAVFPGSREIKVIDQEPPRLTTPDQVMVQILEVGICGTDKEICSFEYGTPPPGTDHLVIGHEALGEVVEVGPAVEHLQPGDLVVPTVRRPCPHLECRACRSGHQDFCYTGDFSERGIKESHGYIAEYVADHERTMVKVPADLRHVAVLTEPLTIAEKAFQQMFWLMQHRSPWLDPHTPIECRGSGLSALVLGAGPVGLLGAMTLTLSGFRTYVYSRELPPSPRIDLIRALGAVYVSSQSTGFTDLAVEVGNVDVIYEAVGQPGFAMEALGILGQNGIYILTGVPGRQSLVEIDATHVMRNVVLKNQLILGTVNAGAQAFAYALRDLGHFTQRWPDHLEQIIGGRYPPEAASELILGGGSGIKSVISFTSTN